MSLQKNRTKRTNALRRGSFEALECRRLLAGSPDDLPDDPAELRIIEPEPFSGAHSGFSPVLVPSSGTFELHSNPNSNYTIYLDFDGHVTEGTTWNLAQGLPTIVSPAYDNGNTPGVFTGSEHDLIQKAWARAAEDFAPFDVNVTTEDPGIEALRKDVTGADTKWGVRVLITADTFAGCGCGGFAYLGSFEDATDEPSYVFNNSLNGVSETISHEVGHQLTLGHDGLTTGGPYYFGHGSGTTGWGSIMGAPFNKRITQWDEGTYLNSNNVTEDDLSDIVSFNGFDYRSDDHGDTRAGASSLVTTGTTSVSAFGIIERNTDVDYFAFTTGNGNVSFDIDPIADRPNLDIWAGIYNSSGALLAQSNPSNDQSASFTNVNLSAGQYFLKIDGVGTHGVYDSGTDSVKDPVTNEPWKSSTPTGYSHYGSLGQYGITGTVVPISTNSFSISPLSATKPEGNSGTTSYSFTVTRSGAISSASSVNYRVMPTRQTSPGDPANRTVDGADFVGGSLPTGTVSFASGQSSKQVFIPVIGDLDLEIDEEFAVVLETPSSNWGFANSRALGVVEGDESQANLRSGVQFRWRQENFTGGDFDHWAIDNVSVSNTTFSENFDPSIDGTKWSNIVGGTANSMFGGTGASLFFTGDNPRAATTNPIYAASGDVLEFDLIFANGLNGTDATESGENVVLEYTIDGGNNWKLIRTYDQTFYKNWTTFSVAISSELEDDQLEASEGNGGSSSIPFNIFRTDSLDKSIDVSWQVVGSGANPANAQDFVGGVLPSGVITLGADVESDDLFIDIAGDSLFESDETFEVVLTASTGGTVGIDRKAAVILNDDIDPGIDIEVTQVEEVLVDPIIAGAAGVHTYTIMATNNGPADATGVVVATPINLPVGQGVVVSYDPSAGTTHSGTTWTVGDLASGATATLNVTLTAPPSAVAGSMIISEPSFAGANETDNDPTNDAPTDLVTSIARRVDIELSQMELVDPVIAGAGATPVYKITAKNNGPSDASGLEIVESLTPYTGVTVTFSTPSAGSVVGSTWTIGDLNAGDSATLEVNLNAVATATPGTDVITSAPLVNAVNESDINSLNQSPSDSTSIDRNVPSTVSVGGSSWAVDLYALDNTMDPILPWFMMNTVQVVYPSVQATTPSFSMEGPTNGSTVSATPSTTDNITFTYTFAGLTDGYYKVVANGVSYQFAVLTADANGLGQVEIIDFTIFAGNYDPNFYIGPTPHSADFNGDGFVEIIDFTIFAGNYLNDLSSFTPPPFPAMPQQAAYAISESRAVDDIFASLTDEGDDDDDLEYEILTSPKRAMIAR